MFAWVEVPMIWHLFCLVGWIPAASGIFMLIRTLYITILNILNNQTWFFVGHIQICVLPTGHQDDQVLACQPWLATVLDSYPGDYVADQRISELREDAQQLGTSRSFETWWSFLSGSQFTPDLPRNISAMCLSQIEQKVDEGPSSNTLLSYESKQCPNIEHGEPNLEPLLRCMEIGAARALLLKSNPGPSLGGRSRSGSSSQAVATLCIFCAFARFCCGQIAIQHILKICVSTGVWAQVRLRPLKFHQTSRYCRIGQMGVCKED